jgi:hypothetical protein
MESQRLRLRRVLPLLMLAASCVVGREQRLCTTASFSIEWREDTGAADAPANFEHPMLPVGISEGEDVHEVATAVGLLYRLHADAGNSMAQALEFALDVCSQRPVSDANRTAMGFIVDTVVCAEEPCVEPSQDPLTTWVRAYKNGRVLHKYAHYLKTYDRHFSKFRAKPVTILEIGVRHGGSLIMWKNYFGAQAVVHGVDIDPGCMDMHHPLYGISVHIGDQGNASFLEQLRSSVGVVDIIIDDGGHKMDQQKLTFDMLFPIVKPGGVYVCEDLHTSYWKAFGAGARVPGTFIEYSKGLIDRLHSFRADSTGVPQKQPEDAFGYEAESMHFYESQLFVEKRDAPMSRLKAFGGQIVPLTAGDSFRQDAGLEGDYFGEWK